jgi:hypothetical protein
VLHRVVRIVLVCALVILLALIAMREVQGIAGTAVHARATTDGRAASAPPVAALALHQGGGA